MPTKVASAPARPKVKLTKLFIDNKWVDPVDGGEFETYNPATGEVIAKVAAGSAADVDKAVKAARRALKQGRGARWTPPIAGACFSSWPTWSRNTPTSWPRSSRSTAARRSPTRRATWAGSSTRCAITRAGPTRSKGEPSRCAATSCRTRCGSRSGSSARSSPGTSRC